MRILIYTHEFLPFAGGIATYCYELACGLCLGRHEVTVVAPKKGEVDLGSRLFRIEWIKAHHMRTVQMLRGLKSLRSVVKDFKPDALLVTEQYALIGVSISRWLIGANSVPIIHGSEVLRHSSRRTLLRRLIAWKMQRFYKTRDLIICASAYARSLLLNAFPVSPTNAIIVHNGMRNRFNPEIDRGDRIRRKWRISQTSTVLLTLARLTPRKGQDVVIRALPSIIAKHPDILYICAGTGPYEETLVRLATDLGLGNHVIFPGLIPDKEKYSYYDACDLFVMPSRREGQTVEGFGLSFLEAWHAAKPVLGGKHGGVIEVIEDGVDGVIVEPEDVTAVADAILSLVGVTSKLEEMGRRGHAKASTKFSDVIMVGQLVKALRDR